MYACFRLPPFGSPRIRAVKKEKKLHLWNWSAVADPGARFENLVACQLLKYCHWVEDAKGFRMELRYLRDTDRREVDFVVLRGGRPQFAVECKTGERVISPSVRHAAERTPIPRFYQVHRGDNHYASGKVTGRSCRPSSSAGSSRCPDWHDSDRTAHPVPTKLLLQPGFLLERY